MKPQADLFGASNEPCGARSTAPCPDDPDMRCACRWNKGHQGPHVCKRSHHTFVEAGQLSPPPPAPHSRGETSRKAASEIHEVLGELRSRVFAFVREQGTHGATCEEVCDNLDMEGNTARPRLWELENKFKLIVASTQRRRTRSGRQAQVYVA